MKRVFNKYLFIFIALILILFYYKNNNQKNEYETLSSFSLEITQYSQKYSAYENLNSNVEEFSNLMVSEKIIEHEYNGYKLLIFKDSSGRLLFAGGKGSVFEIFWHDEKCQESAENLALTMGFDEYKNVLGQDGLVVFYPEKTENRPIIYFYFDNNHIIPLAICNKSNYEIDINGDGVKDIITEKSGQANIIYLLNDNIYIFDIETSLHKVLNLDNSQNSIKTNHYNENGEFIFTVIKNKKTTSIQAFIENNILYFAYKGEDYYANSDDWIDFSIVLKKIDELPNEDDKNYLTEKIVFLENKQLVHVYYDARHEWDLLTVVIGNKIYIRRDDINNVFNVFFIPSDVRRSLLV